jgi:hypothetical protein
VLLVKEYIVSISNRVTLILNLLGNFVVVDISNTITLHLDIYKAFNNRRLIIVLKKGK